MDSAQITTLLTDAGPLLATVVEIEQTEDDRWFLTFQEGVGVAVEWAPESHKLVLAAEAGPVADENRTEVYEQMLAYNGLWQETDGVTLALDTATQTAVLVYDLYAEGLTATLLAAVLDDFAARVVVWRELVASTDTLAAASTLLTTPAGPASESGVRV